MWLTISMRCRESVRPTALCFTPFSLRTPTLLPYVPLTYSLHDDIIASPCTYNFFALPVFYKASSDLYHCRKEILQSKMLGT